MISFSWKLILRCSIYFIAMCFVSACAQTQVSSNFVPLENAMLLPEPNTTLNISSLTACTDSNNATLQLNNQNPVTILVHGCFSSAGRFRALADVFAFHGQQAICFEYDDRQSMKVSSGTLIDAINKLSEAMPDSAISIIGHSQGGLVSRRALIKDREDQKRVKADRVELVTVSSPFAGIEASSHCGSSLLTFLSLGLVKPLCYLITGQKFSEIPPGSDFINQPGTLAPETSRHIRLATDEINSCRRYDKQSICIEDDYVFSIKEQEKRAVDLDSRVKPFTIKAGHVEIVGDGNIAPVKLISFLQEQKLLSTTPLWKRADLAHLLKELYVVQ